MNRFEVIGFDADDTLWHNERLYKDAQGAFRALLGHYCPPELAEERLHQTEMRNLSLFGYGIKGFALSMVETAVQLSDGKVSGAEVMSIIGIARKLLESPVDLLPNAEKTVSLLSRSYPLMLITKGDLLDQEAKLRRSGLSRHFHAVEILSNKRREDYAALFLRHKLAPGRFLMVGNSMRSDIWPVLELGANAVHIPHEHEWAHETAESPPPHHAGFHSVEHLGLLPDLLDGLERASPPPGDGN
jgi:putative hydrolase of the HAD superfamily